MSDFLFAHPSFLAGLGRVLDIGGVFDDYNSSDTAAEADERAMRVDWLAAGADLESAMATVAAEMPREE